jgi:hypothetical protein
MKQSIALLLVVGLVLAGCGVAPETGYDYCYRFDFTSANSWTVAYGTWESGAGYLNDANGNLNLTYFSESVVNPVYIDIGVARRADTGDISAEASGIIFGIEDTFEGTLFSALESAFIYLTPESPDKIGQIANVSITASGEIAISSIAIYGNGVNPCGTSNCGDRQPTPSPTVITPTPFPTIATATSNPTFTPSYTPSISPTPSITPTPTDTPEIEEHIILIDFEAPDGDYDLASGAIDASNSYSSPNSMEGVEIATTPNIVFEAAIDIPIPPGATITYAAFHFVGFATCGDCFKRAYWFDTTTTLESSTENILQFTAGAFDTYGFWEITPNWTGITRLRPSHQVSNGDGDGLATYIDSIEVRYTLPYMTPTPSVTPTVGPSATTAATMTRTPRPTWTPRFTPTGTRNPTRTPIPVYVPPSPTYSPPTLVPTATVIPPPSVTPGPTNTSGPTSTPDGTATVAATSTGTGTPDPSQTPIGEGTDGPPGDVPGDVIGDVGDITGIAGNLFAALANLFNVATTWIGNLSDSVGRVTDAWFNTAPVAPPGAPQCKTNPLQSDLCAIWYILQYTLFSGQVGSLIIPVATAVVDLYILFLFIKFARAILARIGEVFNS